jgi:hypothetical protein
MVVRNIRHRAWLAVGTSLALLGGGTAATMWRAGPFAGTPAPKQAVALGTPSSGPEQQQPSLPPAHLNGPAGAAGAAAKPAPHASTTTRTRGPQRFTYANTAGPIAGTGGQLKRYRVAVETGTGQSPDAFAAAVERVLGDPRSWIASGKVRLQRVPGTAAANFTIFLVSAATSEAMCATGGLHTHRYTSCRLPGRVVINLDRWLGAVPGYGAPLDVYRSYAINHEVGHELGHGHQECPGTGEPAPVMQQQTYGLKGCVANGWPYVDGKEYSGPPIA